MNVDRMIEAGNAREWERQNAGNPDKQEAQAKLRLAIEMVEKALGLVMEAAEAVNHTSATHRVAALCIDLENAENAMEKELRRLKA